MSLHLDTRLAPAGENCEWEETGDDKTSNTIEAE